MSKIGANEAVGGCATHLHLMKTSASMHHEPTLVCIEGRQAPAPRRGGAASIETGGNLGRGPGFTMTPLFWSFELRKRPH
jgi:hypothetical protein